MKDTERSLSPVLFCLDSEYAASAIQGTSQVHKNAVLIEKGKQLYLEEARRRAGGFSFTRVLDSGQATVGLLGTSERMSLRREVRPT